MDKRGRLVGIVLVAGLGLAIWQFMRPAEQPAASMVHPDRASLTDLDEGAPIVEVRLPVQLSTEATIGKRAFEAKCAACHGANAAGQNGVAPPLIHRTYEPSHHSDEAFQMAVQNGVRAHHWPFGNMPPVEGLTRADVQYIVRYVREVQRENGIN
ncbi:cytochrome c [Rhodosalinus sediminis]|jgi:mono/diheme cytochrome c family protein|uniref:Cytochrome c n=1 Tax=Rhodosalinus sediminis TaxID=1940533 RepID=A0A3D9BM78_9RHOB|nr:cytochrome c [Rhodosalinus sediminis]REC54633.1 cytochrome c [Rhodosalinus sediminis]